VLAVLGALIALLVVLIGGGIWWYSQNQRPASSGPKISLGKAEVKDPDPAKLVISPTLGEAPANQVGVILKEGLKRSDAERVATELGGTIIGEIEFFDFYQIETKGATEADLKASLAKARGIQGVDIAFANTRLMPKGIPCTDCSPLGDPTYEGDNGRHFEVIGLAKAWKVIKASGITLGDVHVGILDDALSQKSGEFRGQSTVDGDTTTDDINHGTQVAGVLGADPGNGGITGVASPLGGNLKMTVTNIYDAQPNYTESLPDPEDPTKVLDFDGKTYIHKHFAKIIKQIENGVTIINGSYGSQKPELGNEWEAEACKRFFQRMAQKYPKVLFVVAAGNEDKGGGEGALNGSNYSPGGLKLPNVITVGAIDNTGKKAKFSNYATGDGEVTISAPGVRLPLHIGPDGKLVKASGTSFATPQVTGAAALIRAINPDLTAEQIKAMLVATARRDVQGPNTKATQMVPANLGAGVLRVDLAVIKAINDTLPKDKQIDDKRLEQLATIEGSADAKGAMEYTVKVKLQAVPSDGASVKLELKDSKGAIVTGQPAQKLSAPGEVSWEVILADPKAVVIAHLCRLDTDTCCDIKLQPGQPTPTVVAGATPATKPGAATPVAKPTPGAAGIGKWVLEAALPFSEPGKAGADGCYTNQKVDISAGSFTSGYTWKDEGCVAGSKQSGSVQTTCTWTELPIQLAPESTLKMEAKCTSTAQQSGGGRNSGGGGWIYMTLNPPANNLGGRFGSSIKFLGDVSANGWTGDFPKNDTKSGSVKIPAGKPGNVLVFVATWQGPGGPGWIVYKYVYAQ
jgi:hypothetical protein